MASTTMATLDSILKEVYDSGGVHDQLESSAVASSRIMKTSEGVEHKVGGKYVTFPIRTGRNQGIGARLENEALPDARKSSYEDCRVKLKYLYGALQLTGQAFELADKEYQTFASALDTEVTGLTETLTKDVNRQTYGTNEGKMAVASGAGSTTTLVTDFARYMEADQYLDLYASDGTLSKAEVVVTDVSSDPDGSGTVTFTPAASSATASGDYLTRNGNADKEMTGFGQILSETDTCYNVDPSNTPVWKANVVDNGGTLQALSEEQMIKANDQIRQSGGGTATVGFCSLGVRRAYYNLLQSNKRYVNTLEFTGGFKGLGFVTDGGEIPIVSDVDCPGNRIEFLNEKQLKIYNTGNWQFMNRDGSSWQRVITSSGRFDAYEATLYNYRELGTHRRNAHALLDDVTES